MIHSPFKFLQPYTRKDRDIFFGRDEEIEALYHLVNESNLLLVYGESGTGKTSLIQCGLANRFESSDWLEVFVRRQGNINQSLEQAVAARARTPVKEGTDIYKRVESLFLDYFKPIFLIFDQFEELFIPQEDKVKRAQQQQEQQAFLETLDRLANGKLDCRIILVMREEYIASLNQFEKRLPALVNKRYRIERMSLAQAEKVVYNSCLPYNITFESERDNPREIAQNLLDSRSGLRLPYLQVYLDRLYQEDIVRTYPEGYTQSHPEDWPPLTFTSEEIAELGKINDVLKQFLLEQRDLVQKELEVQDSDFPEEGVKQVLEEFITLTGTREARPKKGFQVNHLTEEQVSLVLHAMVQNRILLDVEDTYELTHDALANVIAEQRDASRTTILEVESLIQTSQKISQRPIKGTVKNRLSNRELSLVATYEEDLRKRNRLTEDDWNYIQKSRRALNRRKIIGRVLVFSSMVVLMAITVFFIRQNQQIREAKKETQRQLVRSLREQYEALFQKTRALRMQRDQLADDKRTFLDAELPDLVARKDTEIFLANSRYEKLRDSLSIVQQQIEVLRNNIETE